jgi:hypothetical protein
MGRASDLSMDFDPASASIEIIGRKEELILAKNKNEKGLTSGFRPFSICPAWISV